MRTLWVFCALAVVFTLHCLTVPLQRPTALSTGQPPHSDPDSRDIGEQRTADDDVDLEREIERTISVFDRSRTKIERVTFSGNKRISQDIFASTLDVKVGAVCDPARNYDALRQIEFVYEALGYLYTKVKLASGGSRHDRDVSFEIDEGPQGMLAAIYFTGNRSIPSNVLRPLLATRVHALPKDLPWLFWSPRDSIWDAMIDEHVLRMRYLHQGFSDARISHVKHLSQDRTRLTVEYIIDEGERTHKGERTIVDIVFRGNSAFSEEELRNALTVREGDDFEMRLLDVVEDQIAALYRDAGSQPPKISMSLVAGSERTTIHCEIDEGSTGGPDVQHVAADVDSDTPTDDRGASRELINADVSASGEQQTRKEPNPFDLDRIAMTGVETFSPEDLRDALKFDPEVVLASHPGADLEGFLKLLEKQIRSGYRHAGFPDAAVRAAVIKHGQRIEIRVTEGARYRCGDLKLSHTLPPDSPLRPLIADPNLLAEYWEKGKPAPFDEITRAKMEAALATEFAGAGYLHPTIDFTINRHDDSGIADIQVTVERSGPRAIVGQIAISGAVRDSEADILSYLDLNSGMNCDSDLPRRIRRRLWESGRYLPTEVNTSPACAASGDETETINITIKLKENAQAPSLAQQLTPAEESLIKLGEWLRRWSHGDVAEDIVATYTEIPDRLFAESPPEGAGRPSAVVPGETKYSMRMVIGPKRGQTLAFTALAGCPEPLFDILVASFPDRLVLVSPQRLTKLEIANPKGRGLSLSLENRVERKRSGQLGIGTRLGATTRFSQPKPNATAFDFDVDLAPAYLLSLAHGPQTTCTLTDGITTVIDAGSTVHIDATSGRLIEFREEFPNGAVTLTIHTAAQALATELSVIEGTLATATAEYDSESPWKSAAEFLVDELHFGAQRSGLVEAERSLCALRELLGLWDPPDPAELFVQYDRLEDLSSNGNFWIPSRSDLFTAAELRKPGSIYRREMAAKWILPVCRELLPKTGWWWPEMRDAALCWATGERGTGRPKVGDGGRQAEVPGPLGRVVLAIIDVLCKIESRPSAAGTDAAQATVGPFRNDYEPLLKGDSWLGRWCVSLAEALRQLDNENLAALELLMPEFRPYDGASSGLEDLKRDPGAPIERVLPAIFERFLGRMFRCNPGEAGK